MSLYDIAPVTPGVAADLSHIPTPVKVEGFSGEDPSPALVNADIVLISAGMARKPGMDRSDLFNINAGIVENLVSSCADNCPKAMIGIITNPVNTTVAIAAEVLKKKGVYDPSRLFGVTTLDVIRSSTFVAEILMIEILEMSVFQLLVDILESLFFHFFSQSGFEFSDEDAAAMTKRIQNAGTEVVEAKAGGGSATLSMGRLLLSLAFFSQSIKW